MHGSAVSYVSSQLLYNTPVLLVAAGGFLAAIAYYRRAPAAARLVLLACVLYFLDRISGVACTAWLLHANDNGALEGQRLSVWMSLVGILGSLLFALVFALLLAAAFVGRPSAE